MAQEEEERRTRLRHQTDDETDTALVFHAKHVETQLTEIRRQQEDKIIEEYELDKDTLERTLTEGDKAAIANNVSDGV